MSKVLIVDDEILSIEYLKSLPSWRKYGCFRIDSVWISTKALECFRKERHEIVFMDIRMPGMDGLSLSREFLRICPETIIVIMTAWQEFDYIKEAMQIGVKHFLVKHEITEEKLDDVLKKITEEIQWRRNYKSVLWNNWLRSIWESGSAENVPEQGTQNCFMGLITMRGVSVVLGEEQEFSVSEAHFRDLDIPQIKVKAFSRLERFTYGVLCEYDSCISVQEQQSVREALLSYVEKICRESGELKPVLYLSGLKTDVRELTDFCALLKRFSKGVLWQRKNPVYEMDLPQYQEMKSDFFPGKKPEEWDTSDLHKLLMKGKQGQYLVELEQLNPLKTFLMRKVDRDFLKEQEKRAGMVSLEQILRASLRFLEEGGIQKSRIVQQAIEYIQMHYQEDISSTLIADALRISDGYLRTVFKKEQSCTIKDYILQYRIDRAKELLQKDERKIYEIAAMCGFLSSQHFSRVFRQVTGMTPGEYKQQK